MPVIVAFWWSYLPGMTAWTTITVNPVYPCSHDLPNIICVAAVDQNFRLAPFSNYGTTSVQIAAPGVNIVSTYTGTDTVLPSSSTAPDNLTSDISLWTRSESNVSSSGWGSTILDYNSDSQQI